MHDTQEAAAKPLSRAERRRTARENVKAMVATLDPNAQARAAADAATAGLQEAAMSFEQRNIVLSSALSDYIEASKGYKALIIQTIGERDAAAAERDQAISERDEAYAELSELYAAHPELEPKDDTTAVTQEAADFVANLRRSNQQPGAPRA